MQNIRPRLPQPHTLIGNEHETNTQQPLSHHMSGKLFLEPGSEPVGKKVSSKTLKERLRVRSLGVNLFILLPPRRTSKIPTQTGALDSTQVMRLPKEQSAGQHMFQAEARFKHKRNLGWCREGQKPLPMPAGNPPWGTGSHVV